MNNDKKYSGITKEVGASTVMRLCSVVIPLFLIAILLGGAVVSFANDIYAFSRPEATAMLYVSEEMELKDFSSALAERKIIIHSAVFEVYARSKGKGELIGSFSGEIYLSSDMSYRTILKIISDEMNKSTDDGESS